MNEIVVNGLFGIACAIIGAILSWVLTTMSMNYGKINIAIKNPVYENDSGVCTLSFDVEVFNGKRERSGLNNCMVVANYDTKQSSEFLPIYGCVNREFNDLSTIEGKSFIKTSYKGSGLEYSGNSKYFFEYIINGKKKKKNILIKL